MTKKQYQSVILRPLFLVMLLTSSQAAVSFSAEGMQSLEDNEMRAVVGQGLIVSDYIQGDDLVGANEYSTPFDFYRVGMDGELELNLNISKLQLGCGGINDHLSGHAGCDIDIDYASLMGRNGTDLGEPGSAFKLVRPYIEFAVKNDDTATLREIAGIKIGAQSADGAIGAGRRYFSDGINQENTAFGASCDTGASVGEGVVGCHSGINSVSGFLGSELSLTMDVEGEIELFPFPTVGLSARGCIGRTQIADGSNCEPNDIDDALFVDLAGTRMQTLGLRSAQLNATDLELDICGFLCIGIEALLNPIANAILTSLYAQMTTDLRSVHKLTLENTPDFFLSFQREPIAYPRYSKTTPRADLLGTTGIYDACAPGSNFATARCDSAYAVPANTGWWMNLPSVKLLDVYNDELTIPTITSLGDVTALLGAPGLALNHPEFDLSPAKNCYGSSTFC